MSWVWISLTRHEGPLLWIQWPAHEQRSAQGILRRQQGGDWRVTRIRYRERSIKPPKFRWGGRTGKEAVAVRAPSSGNRHRSAILLPGPLLVWLPAEALGPPGCPAAGHESSRHNVTPVTWEMYIKAPRT